MGDLFQLTEELSKPEYEGRSTSELVEQFNKADCQWFPVKASVVLDRFLELNILTSVRTAIAAGRLSDNLVTWWNDLIAILELQERRFETVTFSDDAMARFSEIFPLAEIDPVKLTWILDLSRVEKTPARIFLGKDVEEQEMTTAQQLVPLVKQIADRRVEIKQELELAEVSIVQAVEAVKSGDIEYVPVWGSEAVAEETQSVSWFTAALNYIRGR